MILRTFLQHLLVSKPFQSFEVLAGHNRTQVIIARLCSLFDAIWIRTDHSVDITLCNTPTPEIKEAIATKDVLTLETNAARTLGVSEAERAVE